MNWPIGSGKEFKGVYDREARNIISFEANGGSRQADAVEVSLSDSSLDSLIGAEHREALMEDIELLDGASEGCDME